MQPVDFETGGGVIVGQRFEEDRCGEFASQVFFQLVRGNFDAARNVINEAEAALPLPECSGDYALAEIFDLRTSNAIENAFGILYVSQLSEVSEEDLLELPNFGVITLNKMKQELNRRKITWPNHTNKEEP